MMNRTVWLVVGIFWTIVWLVGGWQGVLYVVGTSLALLLALLAVERIWKC